MNRDELQKKAAQFFEDHCTSGYGCCFEHKSVKIETIKNIESALIEVWNEAIEAAEDTASKKLNVSGLRCPTLPDSWNPLLADAIKIDICDRILALKLDEKGNK